MGRGRIEAEERPDDDHAARRAPTGVGRRRRWSTTVAWHERWRATTGAGRMAERPSWDVGLLTCAALAAAAAFADRRRLLG